MVFVPQMLKIFAEQISTTKMVHFAEVTRVQAGKAYLI